ncbi:MAG: Nif3-like dinuclear metal center hexameric protein [Armatimonadetes bacterium]|nr:Nif3-like dinuclear metal center hexameric protein [Candidatus Hippobium faecium]
MKLKELCKALDGKAPAKLYAMDHDKVGLFVGDLESDVKKVLTVTDASSDAIDFAAENNIDLILCHHPFMFQPVGRMVYGADGMTAEKFAPIRNVEDDTVMENKLAKLVKNNIAVFSMHTNLDSVPGGLNDIFCKLLGLKNCVPIETKKEKFYMFIGFVLPEFKEKVLNALFETGAGCKDNYKNVHFDFKGMGNFTPMGEAVPFIGETGRAEKTEEECFSLLVSEFDLDNVAETYKKVHPYEVPVYYVAESPECNYLPSIGRVGDLDEEMSVEDFARYCENAFQIPYVKYSFNCDRNKKIKRVGICSGSGGSMIDEACNMGADAFCCGDIKHDHFLRATDRGIVAFDLGHYETECTSSIVLENYIKDIDENIETVNFEVVRGNKLICRLKNEGVEL